MNGKIRLDSLQMNTPERNNYFLDNLTITAGQVEGQKEIQVLSSFMTAVIRGDYSYNTIPASILQTVQRYIPSLLLSKTLSNTAGIKVPCLHQRVFQRPRREIAR